MLAVFARNLDDGTLDPVQRFELADATVPSLIALSADGAQLYFGGDGLSVYSRDASTGLLTHEVDLALGDVAGLAFANDGTTLLVGDTASNRLVSLTRNASDGSFSQVDSFDAFHDVRPTIDVSTIVAMAPGSDRFWVRAGISAGEFLAEIFLAIVMVDADGQLTLDGASKIGGVTDVSLHGFVPRPGTDQLAIAYFYGDVVRSSVDILAPTAAGDGVELVDTLDGGSPFGLAAPEALAFAPDGRQLYVGGFAGRRLAVIPVADPVRGIGGILQEPLPVRHIEGPVDLATTSDGAVIVATKTGLLEATPTATGVGPRAWTRQVFSDDPSIVPSAEGGRLYAGHSTIWSSIFDRLPGGGFELSEPSANFTMPTTPTPDGAFLAFRDFDDSLVVSAIDSTTGSLGAPADSGQSVSTLRSLQTTPDGRHLLVVENPASGSGRYFAFEASTATLTELSPGAFGSDVEAFAVAPDGEHVYSLWRASTDRLELAVSTREDDSLVGIGAQAAGELGTNREPLIAIDPDGQYLYTFDGSSILRVYRLDLETGWPTLESTFEQGVDGVDWLSAGGVRLATGTNRLYVTHEPTSQLVTLDWNTLFANGFESGDLTQWSDASVP